MATTLRYSAFTLDGRGGNPAGVVLDAADLDDAQMQTTAAELGYSETAFLTARHDEPNVYDVRYFAPLQEVPFCGHATIASAVALAEREPADEMIFHTPAGLVTINTETDDRGVTAELTSVTPHIDPPPEGLVDAVLDTLAWTRADLDEHYPPALADAGAQHLLLVTHSRGRLARLTYDFDVLAAIMREQGLVTVAMLWQETRKNWFARNAFAGSGVVEDPATGAAAAAFGGYLRQLGKIGRLGKRSSFTITQGSDMGRPSLIEVSVIGGEPGIRVKGTARLIED